jgi:hypothetical protein
MAAEALLDDGRHALRELVVALGVGVRAARNEFVQARVRPCGAMPIVH